MTDHFDTIKMNNSQKLIIFAYSLHSGGGLTLLKSALSVLPKNIMIEVYLDTRVKSQISLPPNIKVFWVYPTIYNRLKAEIQLAFHASKFTKVLCLHGLPPLFPCRGDIAIYFQNRHLLDRTWCKTISWRVWIRLSIERFMSRLLKYQVSQFIVQTEVMKLELIKRYQLSRMDQDIKVWPFMNKDIFPVITKQDNRSWDCIYVSDGQFHKNHQRLLDAWELLASEGFDFSLALTISQDYPKLLNRINYLQKKGLKIINLGTVPNADMPDIYAQSTVLIFPSERESYGLPLIEACLSQLPIIAPEKDYVRAVCNPVETFDPYSMLSIAKAVKRFFQVDQSLPQVLTGTDFWSRYLST